MSVDNDRIFIALESPVNNRNSDYYCGRLVFLRKPEHGGMYLVSSSLYYKEDGDVDEESDYWDYYNREPFKILNER